VSVEFEGIFAGDLEDGKVKDYTVNERNSIKAFI
jgi:hypothetical protein